MDSGILAEPGNRPEVFRGRPKRARGFPGSEEIWLGTDEIDAILSGHFIPTAAARPGRRTDTRKGRGLQDLQPAWRLRTYRLAQQSVPSLQRNICWWTDIISSTPLMS